MTVSSTASVLFGVDVTIGIGEFRCCSSSYSVIKRFFNECPLIAVVGGVLFIVGSLDGLFAVDEDSTRTGVYGC